jgi:transposase
MARKTFSVEFRRDAVELYRVTEGATIAKIAADLGVSDATLSVWVKAAGVPIRGRHVPAVPVDQGDEVAKLRARVEELEASEKLLTAEKNILRAAAKYFAGETNW